VAEQTVFDGDIGFGAHEDVGMGAVDVADEVEGEDDGAVGAVLKGDDAAVCAAILDGGEDVGDGDAGGERDGGGGEGVQGGLENLRLGFDVCGKIDID
jgi:hypothetical protein